VKKYGSIFPILGFCLIGYWLFKTSTQIEAGSLESMINNTSKNRYLALLGLACFWVNPAVKWMQSGANIDLQTIFLAMKEQVFPSYGRVVPLWAQFLRFIAGGVFIYFMLTSISIVDDELNFIWNNLLLIFFGGAMFVAIPFLFPKENKNDS